MGLLTTMQRSAADDGVQIAYYEWNAMAAGPPIVLQHGFTTTACGNWFASGIVDALVRGGRRVIALDARGHGQSDKPRDPALYGDVRMARDVMGIVDRLDVEAYDLVGYSMGATIAVNVAVRDMRVRRLVLGGIGAYLVERAQTDGMLFSLEIANALEAENPSRVVDLAGAWLRRVADASGADRLALAALARSTRSCVGLDRIAVPTLVLAGDCDAFAQGADRLASAIPGARLELVPGNHVQVLHDVRYATRMLSFLS